MNRIVAAVVGLIAVAIALPAAPAAAQDETARAEALKAAFVYNFAKFAEWPAGRFASDSAPVVFCVGSDSRLKSALEVLSGKLVGSRGVRIVGLSAGSDLAPCDVLFVDSGLSARLRQLAVSGAVHGLLTVSDMPDFARSGGQIGLVYVNNQLRFQINLGAARRDGMSFSSQLLRLADVIDQQSGADPARIGMPRALRFPAVAATGLNETM